MKKVDDISVRGMIDALDNVTWYNGLAEYVAKWKTQTQMNYHSSKLKVMLTT